MTYTIASKHPGLFDNRPHFPELGGGLHKCIRQTLIALAVIAPTLIAAGFQHAVGVRPTPAVMLLAPVAAPAAQPELGAAHSIAAVLSVVPVAPMR